MNKNICFVVCTHNRGQAVSELLANYVKLAKIQYSVIFLDNSSEEKSYKILKNKIEELNSKFLKIHRLPPLGLSNARNYALKNIDSTYLWFLDDDILIPDQFIEHLKIIENQSLPSVFGGKVTPKFPINPPNWLKNSKLCTNMLSCINYGDSDRQLKKTEFLVGANFCVNSEDAKKCGGFDNNLGRKAGNHLLSNEDIQLVDNIVKLKGREPFYYAGAEIIHLIPIERMKFGWFQKRMFWQAISDIMIGRVYKPKLQNLTHYLEKLPYENRNHRGILMPQNEEVLEAQLNSIYTMTYLMQNLDEE